MKDANNQPISGTIVKFMAPASGASGIFNGSGVSVSIATNSSGIATASTFTANCISGSYTVTASVTGLASTAGFNLTNTAGNPTTITVTSGLGQRALVDTTYQTPLSVRIKDNCGNGLSGLTVTFTAPASGASGSFQGASNSASVTTDSAGLATAPIFTANGTIGNYNVSAITPDFTSIAARNFTLANLPFDYGDFGSGSYQINKAHNGVATMPNFTPPLEQRWTVQLDGGWGFVTYPVVAEHKVFVLSSTPNMDYGNRLWALDVKTGQTIWGPVNIYHDYYWGTLAYDNGRVFVLDYNSKLSAFDASNGNFLWSSSTTGGYSGYSTTPVVAANGLVFTQVANTLRVFRATDGQLVWSRPTQTGSIIYSYPAPVIAGDDGVYVAGPCQKAYKFQIYDGTPLWTFDQGCPFDGQNATLYNNKLYLRAGATPPGFVIDAINGAYLGNWMPSGLLPSFSGNTAFIVNSHGKLEGRDAITGSLLWTKLLQNGNFSVAPVVLNGLAYVGASDRNIYAYDNSGTLQWQGAVAAPNGVDDGRMVSGLGAGEGLLLVPSGNSLIALESVTGNPYAGFGSNPPPGSLINLGGTRLTTTISTTLTISETGHENLVVSNPSFSGANSDEFTLSGATFPLTIVDGTLSQDLTISCTPQKVGSRSATLTLNTNTLAHPTVTYQLSCTGDLVVVQATDDGSGTTPGTLSYYLSNQRAGSGQTISFALTGTSTINITGALPLIPIGVIVDGGNCNAPISLDGSQASGTTAGLVLLGQNQVKALKVLHFPGPQIVANSGGNRLICTSAQK